MLISWLDNNIPGCGTTGWKNCVFVMEHKNLERDGVRKRTGRVEVKRKGAAGKEKKRKVTCFVERQTCESLSRERSWLREHLKAKEVDK